MAQFLISAFADEANETLDGQIKALKRNGVRYIEPRNVNGDVIKKADEDLFAIAKQLDDNGIQVSSLGSPIGKYSIDKPFEDHLVDFRRALRACEILGTKNMRMFSFFVPQDRLEECRDEVMRRMNVLLEEADRAGITLCHENESKIYGQNPKEVEDLLTTLTGLRGIFDAANYVMNDQDPIAGIEATLPMLEYLHIKDARFAEKCIVPCGMGDGQYEEVLRRVDAATDRTVFLTVEPHLFEFKAYARIDDKELKTALDFQNSDDAFDCAVSNLKKTLTKLGFNEEENKIWKK
jgi:sugar phosphate isomerase/epimerase